MAQANSAVPIRGFMKPFLSIVNSKRTFSSKKQLVPLSFATISKALVGPTGSQMLAVCPPAAPPLLLYACSSCGTSFPLDTRV